MFEIVILKKEDVILDRNALDCFHQSIYPPADKSNFTNKIIKEEFETYGKATIQFHTIEDKDEFVKLFIKNDGLNYFDFEINDSSVELK